ncbi:Rieske (2Fe-2S) protein [Silvanigrella aquatica]|uniref:Rieske domain-containing protein n=1 Tax=Silvanigrella aquatica TaxID=1915309 RepID=A0A1L4CZJ7_9BACT|nr:Rieske (2Fe-2S) protein [Silvanigrella aquatica]APJ03371.1 hypothetical protein AXG55_05400 [Silvanigrella aquatica]
MALYKVCLLNELSSEKAIKFHVDGLDILFVKSLQSKQVYAFDNNCNHADKPLEKGKWNSETSEITCPFHKAVFCIAEGGAVKAPPACVPLTVYETEIRTEADGSFVYVNL